ncbi:MAG: hypothetical protein LBG47_04585, partial [Prevotellaceae bacterium]|nr:hypothetical protein [Prevotellaceae bacterium]
MSTLIDLRQEIIFSSSDKRVSYRIKKAEREGKIRKLAPRIYTANLQDAREHIIGRHLFDILRWRFPDAVVSHRSALELRPTETGDFFLTASPAKKVTTLAGITLHVMEGKPALASDVNLGGIYISSEWRWMLECMQISKREGSASKKIPVEQIEDKLEKIIIREGEDGINRFRDKAREVALQLNFTDEFDKLSAIISALLSTHSADALRSASARAAGLPFDSGRVRLFETLYHKLKDYYFPERKDKNTSENSFRLFSFFEAYFSNSELLTWHRLDCRDFEAEGQRSSGIKGISLIDVINDFSYS